MSEVSQGNREAFFSSCGFYYACFVVVQCDGLEVVVVAVSASFGTICPLGIIISLRERSGYVCSLLGIGWLLCACIVWRFFFSFDRLFFCSLTVEFLQGDAMPLLFARCWVVFDCWRFELLPPGVTAVLRRSCRPSPCAPDNRISGDGNKSSEDAVVFLRSLPSFSLHQPVAAHARTI